MKLLASLIFLALSTLALADIPESADIENNAYVKLYREWLEMDFNQVERLEAITENAKLDLERGTRLAEKKVISLEELQDLQLKYKLAILTLERQQMKIREAEARLSIVKAKVASGVGDIPICIRPMDNM